MMYNKVNNVRETHGKKEEAIPMARKWLSGVLAFTMVFGCTAPMALAEEAPVENVENVEDVEQYALYNPRFEKSSYKMENKVGAKLTIKLEGAPKKAPKWSWNGSDDISDKFNAEYDAEKGVLSLEINATFDNVDTPYTLKATFPKVEGDPDTYVTYTAETEITFAKPEDLTVTPSANEFKDLRVGETSEIVYTVGADKKPYSVSVKPTIASEKYVKFTTEDAKDSNGKVIGTKVVATGIAETPDKIEDNVSVKISVKATADSDPQPYEIANIKVEKAAKPADAVTMMTLDVDKTTVGIDEISNLVAQAYKADDYGDNIAYDNAKLEWYLNGTKMTFENNQYVEKDITGAAVITVTQNAKVPGIIAFKATKAGTYTLMVSDGEGLTTKAVKITVEEKDIVAKNVLHIAKEGDWNANDAEGGKKVVKVGGTLDLSGIRFAGRDEATDKGYSIADLGISVTGYKVGAITVGGKTISAENVEKIVKIEDNGAVTIADENNALMQEVLALAKGADITVPVTVSFKDVNGKADYSLWGSTPVQITIAKPSEDAASMELYLNGEKVTDRSIVLNVGEKYDFDVKVKDAHDYTESVDQRVVWDITGNDKDTVYATVDQNGVVTPKLASIDKAALTVVSINNPDVRANVSLIIVGEEVKPTEKPTEQPTEQPTEKPTEKPEVQKGKVATSSGSLNMREEPSTSADRVGSLKKGAIVTILAKEGDWLLVTDGEQTGYVAARYIDIIEDKPEQPETGVATVKTKGGALNMRKTASSKGTIITKIANGTTVTVVEKGDDWTKIKYNGKTGYVSTQYLEFEEDAVG